MFRREYTYGDNAYEYYMVIIINESKDFVITIKRTYSRAGAEEDPIGNFRYRSSINNNNKENDILSCGDGDVILSKLMLYLVFTVDNLIHYPNIYRMSNLFEQGPKGLFDVDDDANPSRLVYNNKKQDDTGILYSECWIQYFDTQDIQEIDLVMKYRGRNDPKKCMYVMPRGDVTDYIVQYLEGKILGYDATEAVKHLISYYGPKIRKNICDLGYFLDPLSKLITSYLCLM